MAKTVEEFVKDLEGERDKIAGALKGFNALSPEYEKLVARLMEIQDIIAGA